ncbi:LysR family transcriptional regulator [Bradyrhizobium sp. Tv2a-2]|uniref:LysR family transcriptional regulator n=1 Tax=Bradyrhizobium sp. Tv2a-2 TaxID=113395 RepID=UPI0004672D36|nr:LysR family transcriptional regulator [Bradyrhizobium sp. Tv2a-2]
MSDFKDQRVSLLVGKGLELRHLRSAVAAADCGSFRQAAELLRSQQSTISRSIDQIEHCLGIKLFERSTGGVAPTPAGQRALRQARIILEEFDALIALAKSEKINERDRLAVGFCTSLSAGNLQASLLDFKQRCPSIELKTFERSRVRLATALRNGVLDIFMSYG